MIHGLMHVKCEVDLDKDEGGWITIIVHGPATIPARAKVSVQIRCETAQPQWLANLPDAHAIVAEAMGNEGLI